MYLLQTGSHENEKYTTKTQLCYAYEGINGNSAKIFNDEMTILHLHMQTKKSSRMCIMPLHVASQFIV